MTLEPNGSYYWSRPAGSRCFLTDLAPKWLVPSLDACAYCSTLYIVFFFFQNNNGINQTSQPSRGDSLQAFSPFSLTLSHITLPLTHSRVYVPWKRTVELFLFSGLDGEMFQSIGLLRQLEEIAHPIVKALSYLFQIALLSHNNLSREMPIQWHQKYTTLYLFSILFHLYLTR